MRNLQSEFRTMGTLGVLAALRSTGTLRKACPPPPPPCCYGRVCGHRVRGRREIGVKYLGISISVLVAIFAIGAAASFGSACLDKESKEKSNTYSLPPLVVCSEEVCPVDTCKIIQFTCSPEAGHNCEPGPPANTRVWRLHYCEPDGTCAVSEIESNPAPTYVTSLCE